MNSTHLCAYDIWLYKAKKNNLELADYLELFPAHMRRNKARRYKKLATYISKRYLKTNYYKRARIGREKLKKKLASAELKKVEYNGCTYIW